MMIGGIGRGTVLASVLALIGHVAAAAILPTEIWTRVFSYGEYSNDFAYDITADSGGNVYVCGYCDAGLDGEGYMTVKYDSLGNVVWNRLHAGIGGGASAIAVDAEGSVYICGDESVDYNVVKYDSAGSIVWDESFDSGVMDVCRGIAVDSSGNAYITGMSSDGSNTVCRTMKYDSLGNVIWNKVYGGVSYASGFGIVLDSSGNVLVTGASVEGGPVELLTVKYDPAGNLLWNRTYYIGPSEGRDITVDTSGNIYQTGYLSASSNDDILTVKCNSSGDLIWSRTYDVTNIDLGDSIAVDSVGNIFVTGNSYDLAERKCQTVKYDPAGNAVWSDTYYGGYGDYGGDYGTGAAIDSSGHLYLTAVRGSDCGADFRTTKYQIADIGSGSVKGELRITPNVFELSNPSRVLHFIVKGNPGGIVEMRIYDEAGTYVGAMSLQLDGSGNGDLPFIGVVDGKALGTGIYHVSASGAGVDLRKSFVVVSRRRE